MSSSSSSVLVLVLLALTCLISPTIAQTCRSQNLRTTFETCLDLPVLNSNLHYTYNATNSSLSVAFVATPSVSNGWVAWAINPTAKGMVGSQAFIAHRSGRVPQVKTYDIGGYMNLTEGRLSFDFWDLRVETMSGDRIVIYTTVKVPRGADKVNQVWQIGGVWNTTTDRPGIHPATPGVPNLRSVAELRLAGEGPSPAPTSGGGGGGGSSGGSLPGSPAGSPPGSPGNAGSMSTSVNFGVNLGILVLLGSFFIL